MADYATNLGCELSFFVSKFEFLPSLCVISGTISYAFIP
ncbi:hypothetical protein GPLA_4054 [Paraglaciecola polaris LMG 21857]|uniref:Uncharacterized protein n=1 Tax=Paraglaciecola polaris LMG 21857 TaxID=1129793 RepID=K7A1X5_9ALTE|nr:hypothetical protein GPLA_4054 [Paraglaciecola polaris LMG 21857]